VRRLRVLDPREYELAALPQASAVGA
jgi:hypothetical protein